MSFQVGFNKYILNFNIYMEDMDVFLALMRLSRFVGFQCNEPPMALWPRYVVDRQSVIRPIFPDWPRGE